MANVLIVGAGMQAEAIAYDLGKRYHEISLIDKEKNKLGDIYRKLSERKIDVITEMMDASDQNRMSGFLEKNPKDLIISAASYTLNEMLTRIAIKNGSHFIDLGGNDEVIDAQFNMNREAKEKGVTVFPGCGFEPGSNQIITAYGIQKLGIPDYIKNYAGGLPQEIKNSLEYMLLFSPQGVTNEYKQPSRALINGTIMEVESLTGEEIISIYDERLKTNKFKARNTSGGLGTSIESYGNVIHNIESKTLRYPGDGSPGHFKLMKAFKDIGCFEETRTGKNGKTIYPRKVFEKWFEEKTKYDGKDLSILRVELGYKDKTVCLDVVDFYDEETGFTSMQRMTGFSAAIVAGMILDGRIDKRGVLYQEMSVDPKEFVKEWEKRDIYVTTTTRN